MLIELTLWGQRDLVRIAIERLRQFEPEEGYYLAYSGGKDSIVVLELARRAGVQFDAHYSLTTVDPPELVQFIRREEPSVIWDRSKRSMWELIVYHQSPPTRRQRYCCRALKEDKGIGRVVVTGIRAEESRARKRRAMVETCYSVNKRYLHPIIDWSEADVWQFIRENGLPYCSLYDEGFKRLGCVMCPMKGGKLRKRDAARWPKYCDSYLRTFGRMLARRAERGKETYWATPEEVMAWWLSDRARVDANQIPMFA